MKDEFNNEMKICFVGNLSSSFIKKDYEILGKYFNLNLIKPPKSIIEWMKYPLNVAKKVKACDVIFCWFAGWHSAIPIHYAKKYKKKSIVVAGGYDAAYVPEIDYGAFSKRRLLKEGLPARFSLNHADIVLPVSNFTKNDVLKHAKPKQIKVVYNVIDTNKFKPKGKKEKLIMTIGSATKQGIKIKGLETFAKASNHFPDYKFVIIGGNEELSVKKLKEINPNLIFTGNVTHDEVLSWLQRAKIYCQLSYVESFGMGVAEAMGCECVPIVTNTGGLPEVVGDTGFYVPHGNEKAIADAIKKALNTSKNFGKKAKKRIKEKFLIKTRKENLVRIIETLMEK